MVKLPAVLALVVTLTGIGDAGYVQLNLQYPGVDHQSGTDAVLVEAERHGSGINGAGEAFNWSLSGKVDMEAGVLKSKAQVNNSSDIWMASILSETVAIHGIPLSEVIAIFEMDVDGHSSIKTVCDCFSAVRMITYLRADQGPSNIRQSSFDYAWQNNNIGQSGEEFYKHDALGNVDIRDDTKGAWDFTLRVSVPLFLDANGISTNVNLTQWLELRAAQSNGGAAAIDVWDTVRLRVGFTGRLLAPV